MRRTWLMRSSSVTFGPRVSLAVVRNEPSEPGGL
jgi:hypothetical protein